MIYVIFGTSVLLGGCVALALRTIERRQISATEPQPRKAAITSILQNETSDIEGLIENLKQVTNQISTSIKQMEEQQDALAVQQEVLTAKKGREGLIARYEKDRELLSKQIQAQKKAGGVAWRTIQLLEIRSLYGNIIKQQPQLSMPKSPEEAKDAEVYKDSIRIMKDYLDRVCNVRDFLASVVYVGPDNYIVPPNFISEMVAEQKLTVGLFSSLIERLDRSIDCLIYFENWVHTNQLNVNQVELPQHDKLLHESLTEISVVMSDLQVLADNEEAILRDLRQFDVEDKIRKITDAATDMKARVDAEKEIAQLFSHAIRHQPL